MDNNINGVMYTTETTIGARNEAARSAGVPLQVRHDITLNAKRGIHEGIDPVGYPTDRYLGYGIGGFKNIDTGTVQEAHRPKASNKDLYNPLPFRIVPVDEDLTEAERAVYRLRTKENINGVFYWAYWLKKITPVDNTVKAVQVQPPDNTEQPYVEDPADLNPVPPSSSWDENADPRVIISTEYRCVVTAEEMREAISVLRNGDMRLAALSEISINTGIDKEVVGVNHLGDSFNYVDSTYVHMAIHRCHNPQNCAIPGQSCTQNINFENGTILGL